MKRYIIVLLIIGLCSNLLAQEVKVTLTGQISFVSSQNVYVKFISTSGISVGDTLCSKSGEKLIPALVVNNLSSTSCVGTSLRGIAYSAGETVIAMVLPVFKKSDNEVVSAAVSKLTLSETLPDSTAKKAITTDNKQSIRGSVSLNSYSDLSNTGADNSQRFRYTLSLNAGNIANSKFSVETYISFKHKAGDWQDVKSNLFNALKIYSLAARYDINKTTQISLGRRINPRISSIGAMDGLQFETSVNRFVFGAVAGSRPDYINYGFDPGLFQYGGYIAFNTKGAASYTETSLAFMQQMNNSKTDRRFLYFQHSNNVIKNVNFFGTIEADLYELKIDSLNNQTAKNSLSLTGLYLSLSYRPGRNLSLSGSYDARKNVMYYETYKTFVDRILENEMRQGFRLQASYRITRDLTLGLQSGYRYLKSDPHPSKNIYGYLTYNQIPGVNISATISGTLLESNYMNGNIYSLNLTRDFFKGKLQTGAGYRYVDYRLPDNFLNLLQNIGEASLSWQMFDKTSLSASYEGTFEKQDQYNRIYLQLRKRF